MEAVSQTYHRLTAYRHDRHWLIPSDDERIVSTFLALDDSQYPAEFKAYPAGLPRVALPTEPPSTSERFDLAALSRLLYFSAGVLRYREKNGGRTVHYRAAPSAGNRHPLELYVCARDIDGLDDGVWHYSPNGHVLVRIAPPAECEGPALVLTGVPWRTCWKYAERGYRHVWWDAGAVVAQLHALAERLHIGLGFADRDLARLVGADLAHEFPLVVISLGHARPAPRAARPAVAGDLGPVPVAFPLISQTHRAGELSSSQAAAGWSELSPARSTGPGFVEPVEEVIKRRGSTRRFDATAAVPFEAFTAAMRAAEHRPAWDSGDWPLTTHVLVHAVDGVPPGVYRWHGELELVRAGEMREQARVLCGGQDPAHDCAFLVLHTARVDHVLSRRGERGYRVLQFAAGFAAGGLYLAAFGQRLGCTGLTITDSTVPALVGEPIDGLLASAVGIPAHPPTHRGKR